MNSEVLHFGTEKETRSINQRMMFMMCPAEDEDEEQSSLIALVGDCLAGWSPKCFTCCC